jgi:O-antigen/teichoic acid export membrane protein
MNLARNIFTTLSARVLVVGLALVSSVVLARGLGPEGRGVFALLLLLPELVKSLGLLGFEQANAVFAGLEPQRRRALAWHSAWTALTVGTIVAAAAIGYVDAGAPGLESLTELPLWLCVLPLALVPARLLTEYWSAVLRGMNRILVLNVVEVSFRLATLALMVLTVVTLGGGVAGAVAADSGAVLGMVVVLGVLLGAGGALGQPTIDAGLWKRTARFALPTHCASIMSYLNYRIDQFIIAVLLPPEQLAFYVIAVDIAERLWIIPGAVSTALLPHLTNSPRRDPATAALVARHAVIWTGLACVVVGALAGVAVEVLYSTAYAETASPLRWLLPGVFTLTVGKVLVAELLARTKVRFTIWLSAIAVTVNVGANLLLIPRLGLAGAGMASSLSYTAVAVVVAWYYVRETGVPWSALVPRGGDLLAYIHLLRRLRRSPHLTPAAQPAPVQL